MVPPVRQASVLASEEIAELLVLIVLVEAFLVLEMATIVLALAHARQDGV